MKNPRVNDYMALSAPFFSDMETVPDNSNELDSKVIRGKSSNAETPIKPRKTGNAGKKGKRSKKGKKDTLIAKTYKLPPNLVQDVERIAYWQRRKIQDVVCSALSAYIETVEKEDLKPIPDR